MKYFKKYMAVILAITLCSPMTISAEETGNKASISTADKAEGSQNQIGANDSDQVSEHNTIEETPKETADSYEDDNLQKDFENTDVKNFQSELGAHTDDRPQNSDELSHTYNDQKILDTGQIQNVQNDDEYLELERNENIDKLANLQLESINSENLIDTNIYQVVMPTNTDGIFDFILDPESLINTTNAAAHGGKTFEENSTLFFHRLDGQSPEDYSNKSDFVTITNKSSIPVDVHLEIQIIESSIPGISMSDNREFIDDNRPSLYLALLDGEQIVPIGPEGISIDVTVDAAPEGAYEYVYDTENIAYAYRLKDDLSEIRFHEYSFQLTGAANGKGDWSNLTNITPEIVVTWMVTPSKGLISENK